SGSSAHTSPERNTVRHGGMMTVADKPLDASGALPDPARFWTDAVDYVVDAAQRTILFWDAMRQRGNQYEEQQKRTAPNVLSFPYEIVIDGRTLARPVNYGIVRIVPPEG